jgi:tripartite-type tricarboxylate transporter receptor subunit TctC
VQTGRLLAKPPPRWDHPANDNEKLGERAMSFSRSIRHKVILSALLLLGISTAQSHADTYPSRRINFIVAFAPGGVADTLARQVAHGLEGKLGQSVVVENRPGAGGNLAAGLVARANPDGYTFLLTTTALAINLTLHKNNPFAGDDLKTVAILASSPEALMVNPSSPSNNLAEFVKTAKGKSISFGSAGVGSGSHIQAEYFFKEIAKIQATHVPFQGGAPAINAAMGNQIDVLATTLGGLAASQIQSGKLKGLGIAAQKRAAVTPNVPTYGESGFPGFYAASWVGIFAPSKTDPAILNQLNAAVEEVMKDPETQKKLASIGFDPIYGNAAEAEKYFRSEVANWGKMVKAVGLSIP